MFKKNQINEYSFKVFEYALEDLTGCFDNVNGSLGKNHKIYYDVVMLPYAGTEVYSEYLVTAIAESKIMDKILNGYVKHKDFNIQYLGAEAA